MKRRVISVLLLAVILLTMMPHVSLAASRTFKVKTNVDVDSKGRVTVYWTDSSNASPYEVDFQCLEGSIDQTIWIGATKVGAKKYTLPNLIPGYRYKITVIDKNGDYASANIKAPRKKDMTVDMRKLSRSVELCYKKDDYVQDKDAITLKKAWRNAESIEKRIKKGNVIGFKYTVKYGITAKRATPYYMIVAITSPSGYAIGYYYKDFKRERVAGTYNYLNANYFNNLYKCLGYVESGKYKIQVFLNGKLYFETKYNLDSY